MKSITIHGMDDILEKKIREAAKKQRLSLNKTIKKLLEKALRINQEKNYREDYLDLFGTWSEEDLKEFKKNTRSFEKIDPGDWE